MEMFNLNLNQTNNSSKNTSKDAQIAKNIVDILFEVTNEKIKDDKEMGVILKTICLKQLPKISTDTKNHIGKMDHFKIKKLLDDIQIQLNSRK